MGQADVRTAELRVISGLEDDDRRELLTLARSVVGETLQSGRRALPYVAELPPRLREPGASYVTLRRGSRLLGSVGTLEASVPIGVDVVMHALTAAFDDPRIPSVTADDFHELSIEVAVVGPLVPSGASGVAELVELLRPEIDGLVVDLDGRRVTFLPAVWDNVRDEADFVALLWRKAALAVGEWPSGLRTFTYRTEAFSDQQPG